MILPRARSQCGRRDQPVLFGGCRLNVVVDMSVREMHVELLSDSVHAEGPTGVESKVEVELLPAEVAVSVSLGSPRKPGQASRVRLVGASHDPPEVHSLGKTVKDLWDEDNVVKLPLHLQKSGGHGRAAGEEGGGAFSTLNAAMLAAIGTDPEAI